MRQRVKVNAARTVLVAPFVGLSLLLLLIPVHSKSRRWPFDRVHNVFESTMIVVGYVLVFIMLMVALTVLLIEISRQSGRIRARRVLDCMYVRTDRAKRKVKMAEPVVRLTVNVSPEVAQLLDDLAQNQMKTTKTQALNQAIATTAALYKAQADGGQVVVKKGNSQQTVNLPKS